MKGSLKFAGGIVVVSVVSLLGLCGISSAVLAPGAPPASEAPGVLYFDEDIPFLAGQVAALVTYDSSDGANIDGTSIAMDLNPVGRIDATIPVVLSDGGGNTESHTAQFVIDQFGFADVKVDGASSFAVGNCTNQVGFGGSQTLRKKVLFEVFKTQTGFEVVAVHVGVGASAFRTSCRATIATSFTPTSIQLSGGTVTALTNTLVSYPSSAKIGIDHFAHRIAATLVGADLAVRIHDPKWQNSTAANVLGFEGLNYGNLLFHVTAVQGTQTWEESVVGGENILQFVTDYGLSYLYDTSPGQGHMWFAPGAYSLANPTGANSVQVYAEFGNLIPGV
ncbi:MAG: hypothetical protein KDD70_18340 [Bdellovibrionales bacterium]|nr:hypothetical protein [Bdellovibrionales bacterium]